MYAIIKQGSHQYQVRPDSTIDVFRLDLEPGADFISDQVLLVGEEGGTAQVGAPYVAGYTVRGTVMGHYRDRKIIVFKMKRRKDYRRKQGHRQEITRIKIESIEQGKAPAVSAKPAAAPEAKIEPQADTAAAPKAKTAPKKETPAKAKAETVAKPKTETPAKGKVESTGGKTTAKVDPVEEVLPDPPPEDADSRTTAPESLAAPVGDPPAEETAGEKAPTNAKAESKAAPKASAKPKAAAKPKKAPAKKED